MKLKYLFLLLITAVAFMTSCDDDDSVTLLKGIQVSSSFVTLSMNGDSDTIVVKSQAEWTLEKVVTKEDSAKWLEISSVKGPAGESEIIFKAPATLDGRNAEILIHSAGQTQRVKVMQGLPVVSEVKVKDILDGPEGKLYRVTGVCTSISNTQYGNWNLTDETGTILIYGTLDEKGQPKNFLSLGIEVGDEITVEGPKKSYRGEPQMVDVTVVSIKKSLVKVDSVENEVLPLEGGVFTAFVTSKGQGLSVDIPENAKSWLSVLSIDLKGTEAVVKFQALENKGGDRNTTIIFRTTDGAKDYTSETTLTQKGSIVAVTVAEFLAAEVGDTQYRLSGVITKLAEAEPKYGNLYLTDFSGETYVYGIKDFLDQNLKEGDIITIVGKRAAYNDSPQVGGAVLESVIRVIPATIAEVLAKPESPEVYYLVTGEITLIDNPVYGNLYLKDGDSEIFLYGCYPGYGATGDYRKGLIDAKGIKVGDRLTVIATKGSHEGAVQLANGLYYSHESAE